MKTAISVTLAALLLAGCSTSSNNTVDAVENTYQNQDLQVPIEPSMSAEDMYLRDVHAQNNPDLEDETDRDLLNIGYETCNVLDQGYTVEELVLYLLSEGNPSDAEIKYQSIIIGNAIEYLCPEYLDQV